MQTLTSRIAKNTGIQIAGRAFGTILGLFSLAILARYLGPEGYGGFTTITSFLQFFGVLVDFGLTLTAVRMISAPGADEKRIMGAVFSLRLVSAILFFGLAALIGLFFPYSAEIKLGIAVGGLAYAGMVLAQVLGAIFQKYLRMERAALAEVAGRAVLLLGIAAAAYFNLGLLAAIWALVAGNAVQVLLMLGFGRPLVPFRLSFETKLAREIIRQSWPIGISIAFNLIYLRGDIIILSVLAPQSEVGLYGAAYKVLDVVTVIPMMFMGLVLPILTEAWARMDLTVFRRRLQKAFDFSAILALPMIGGAAVLGVPIMELVAGSDFRASGILMQILILAGAAVFFSGLYGHAIVAIGAQRKAIWAYAVTAAAGFVFYVFAIPKMGAAGAAWGTVFSEILIALLLFVLTWKFTKTRPETSISLRALLAAILMTLSLIPMRNLPVLLAVIAGAVIYAALLYIFRVLTKESLRELMPQKIS